MEHVPEREKTSGNVDPGPRFPISKVEPISEIRSISGGFQEMQT